MQVNHNINAMVTKHALFSANGAMAKSLEKLSTGLKINRAQDDAAGLAMSEQMRTQIRGLGKAKQNAMDGIGLLQIAEGGLAEITNIMQRQRELAVQAANDTLTSTERDYLNKEFTQLTREISRISLTTNYNGKNLLNYTQNPNLGFGAVSGNFAAATAAGRFKSYDAVMAAIADGGTIDREIEELEAKMEEVDPDSATYGLYEKKIEKLEQEKARLTKDFTGDGKYADKANSNFNYNAFKGPDSFTLHVGPNYSRDYGGKLGNELTVKYASIQANANDLMSLTIMKADGSRPEVAYGKLQITSQTYATQAIDNIDDVIKTIAGIRAEIGSYVNRLEFTINNIANLEFNTQDAESRIRDTDFSYETTQFTKNQIMVQAGVSMLGQANALPQSVLGLLG